MPVSSLWSWPCCTLPVCNSSILIGRGSGGPEEGLALSCDWEEGSWEAHCAGTPYPALQKEQETDSAGRGIERDTQVSGREPRWCWLPRQGLPEGGVPAREVANRKGADTDVHRKEKKKKANLSSSFLPWYRAYLFLLDTRFKSHVSLSSFYFQQMQATDQAT